MALVHCGRCETRFAVGVDVCPHCGATEGHYQEGEARPFQPGEHTVDDVNRHLADSDDDERARVVEAEVRDKNRAGVLDKWAQYRADAYDPPEEE